MNIFYLDADPVKCAQAHVDKHVVKMILEYAQLLAHRVIDGQLTGERDAALYKASLTLIILVLVGFVIHNQTTAFCLSYGRNY